MKANTLGILINEKRESLGISKREFAKALGVNERTVTYWESLCLASARRPKLSMLIKISCLLNLQIDMFIE